MSDNSCNRCAQDTTTNVLVKQPKTSTIRRHIPDNAH